MAVIESEYKVRRGPQWHPTLTRLAPITRHWRPSRPSRRGVSFACRQGYAGGRIAKDAAQFRNRGGTGGGRTRARRARPLRDRAALLGLRRYRHAFWQVSPGRGGAYA